MPSSNSPGRSWISAGIVVLGLAALLWCEWHLSSRLAFVGGVAVLTLMAVGIGHVIVGRAFGILINEQNVMSLARFQLLGWTILILGAYVTYVFQRLRTGDSQAALDVGIDKTLWILMGISTTSLVGSAAIASAKGDLQPDEDSANRTAALTRETPADVLANGRGTLYANDSQNDAQFTDLFQGDEIGNAAHVSLGKLQMFYITLVILAAYAVVILKTLNANPHLDSLPVLPEGLIAILGISHAGYLSTKASNHTQLKSAV